MECVTLMILDSDMAAYICKRLSALGGCQVGKVLGVFKENALNLL